MTETDKYVYVFTCIECNVDKQNKKGLSGTLTFLDHAFVFNDREKNTYFGVNNKIDSKNIEMDFNLKNIVQDSYLGSGITFNKIDKSNYENEFVKKLLITDNITKFITDNNINKSVGCFSGGEGATSCGITGGCNVSCGEGYYACCNSSGCECVKTRITEW